MPAPQTMGTPLFAGTEESYLDATPVQKEEAKLQLPLYKSVVVSVYACPRHISHCNLPRFSGLDCFAFPNDFVHPSCNEGNLSFACSIASTIQVGCPTSSSNNIPLI